VCGETKEIHKYSQSELPISGPGDQRGISPMWIRIRDVWWKRSGSLSTQVAKMLIFESATLNCKSRILAIHTLLATVGIATTGLLNVAMPT